MTARPDDAATILAARRHVGIVHHVAGRIRLRFDPAPLSTALGGQPERLRGVLSRIRGIEGTELNLAARSLVVRYDPAVLPPGTWEQLLTADAADVASLLAGLQRRINDTHA